ncbi:MAG TPA: murein biosynthesis integral membrane protein MurJ, partial [Terricaulis sp.]|nr:murein biosynthesis integral membrane protein MurJ [Terricaulis sp.]
MMIAALGARGAYAPSAQAISRFVRIVLVSAGLGLVLYIAQANRAAIEGLLGPKEVAVAVLILGGGISYFVFLFLTRAVTLAEVRAAMRREKGAPAGGGGLPPSLDG